MYKIIILMIFYSLLKPKKKIPDSVELVPRICEEFGELFTAYCCTWIDWEELEPYLNQFRWAIEDFIDALGGFTGPLFHIEK